MSLILVAPLVAVLVLSGVQLTASAREASQAGRARTLTELAGAAGALSYALQVERAAAAVILMPAKRAAERSSDYADAIAMTDRAVGEFRIRRAVVSAAGADDQLLLERIDAGVRALTRLRSAVLSGDDTTWSAAVLRYRLVIADLLSLRAAPARAGLPGEVADQVRAAVAAVLALEQVAVEHLVVVRAAGGDRLTPAALEQIVAARAGFEEARQDFVTLASPAWRTRWDQTITGEPVLTAQRLEGQVSRTRLDARVGVDIGAWTTAMLGRMAAIREVVAAVDVDVLVAVTVQRDRQVRAAAATTVGVSVGIAVMVAGALWVAAAIGRRLRGLRASALAVAGEVLPRAVELLRDPNQAEDRTPEQAVAAHPIPMPIRGADEIREVGDAIVRVAREALRLAAEQAGMRQRSTAMYVNIARRQRALVRQMVQHLDVLQQDEEDPDRLAKIFDVDHAANQALRYVDGLMTLAGAPPVQVYSQPAELRDVLVAAAGQIREYRRVEYGMLDAGVAVRESVVEAMVHLFAELLDNATAFSPPGQPVIVAVRRVSDRAIVTIEDRGIGVPADKLEELNVRLGQAPEIDLVALRSMGIAIVAAIATSHGMAVRLVSAGAGGMVAEVVLPAAVLVLGPRRLREDAGAPAPAWPVVPRPFDRPRDVLAVVAGQPAAVTANASPQAVIASVAGPGWDAPTQPTALVAACGDGWQAADAAAHPSAAGLTADGLPIRRPMAQLVPGSMAGAVAQVPARDPHVVAARITSFHRGLRQGRRAATTPFPPHGGDPR